MKTPRNLFKQALREQRPQIGLWLGLANSYSAEICAAAGFDWLLIDGEHAPNDVRSVLEQLQTIAGYPAVHAAARVPVGHGDVGLSLIKQYLDIGVQTLLVPMVDTAQQAADLVRAVRYPPTGLRGMAGARASGWGRYPRYAHEANEQICLLVQIESKAGLDNLDTICATDGIDGVFIGPADLSASLGHVGEPGHADVQAAIGDVITRVVNAGKGVGILSTDETLTRRYLGLGATFVAVGLDTNLLMRGTAELAARYRADLVVMAAGKTY